MHRVLTLLLAGALLITAGPAAAATDTTKPRVRFVTEDGAVLVGAPVPHELTEVRGVATDRKGRGIRRVTITFCANATRSMDGAYTCSSTGVASPITRETASLTCANSTRRRCDWTVAAPLTPGSYLVFAEAVDRAGNRRSAGPILITVV